MNRFLDLWWAAQSARWALFVEFWWLPAGLLAAACIVLAVRRIP